MQRPWDDEQDVISAWNNALPLKKRDVPRNSLGKDEYVTIGIDTRGRPIELVATPDMAGRFWLVYHGVGPAAKGFVRE